MKTEKDPIVVAREFFTMIEELSKFKDEVRPYYMLGYLQSLLEDLAHDYPGFVELMQFRLVEYAVKSATLKE